MQMKVLAKVQWEKWTPGTVWHTCSMHCCLESWNRYVYTSVIKADLFDNKDLRRYTHNLSRINKSHFWGYGEKVCCRRCIRRCIIFTLSPMI